MIPMDPTLRTTIGKALAGDQKAFEALIREFGRIVYAHAYSILRQREEAEDVAQESFLKAWQAKWRVRDPDKFPQWLFTIARNRALDTLKRRKPVPLNDPIEEMVDVGIEKPDDQLEGSEMRERIHDVLGTLPEHHRLAVTLRYLEEMDFEAIQETMGLTNGALRGILGRAMATLRSQLKVGNGKLEIQNTSQ